MTVALIIAAALVVTGLILCVHHRLTDGEDGRDAASSPDASAQADGDSEEQCCGMHITCEKDSLLTALADGIVYYDDEELDMFAGRQAESYTDEETERFRDVLLTLMPEDIAGWARSIQLRGITLPLPVRDELIMIVSEAREAKHHA